MIVKDDECPKCKSLDLSISNVDGFECCDCGCWFDVDENGELLFIHDFAPTIISIPD